MKVNVNCIQSAERRILYSILLTVFFVTAFSISVKAENVFLKNGLILADVKIVSESADSVTVTTTDKKEKRIPRSQIHRINNLKLSMRKIPVYNRLYFPQAMQERPGCDFDAYLVDKNDRAYTFRYDLYSPEEFIKKKTDLWMVPDKNVAELKAEGRIKSSVSFDVLSIIGVMGSFSGLLLAFVLYKIKRGNHGANKILALFLVIIAVNNCYGIYFSSGMSIKFPHLVDLGLSSPYLAAPVLYWYVLKLTRPGFKLKFLHILHLAPFIMAVLYLHQHAIFITTEEMILLNYYYIPHPIDIFVFDAYLLQLGIYFYFIFKILAFHRKSIRKKFSSISNIELRWLNFFLYGCFSMYIILLFFIGFFYLKDPENLSNLYIFYILWPILYSIFIVILGCKGLMQHEIFTDPRTVPAEIPDVSEDKLFLQPEKIREIIDKLTAVMDETRPYLDPELTLPVLADMINVPRNYLSLAINEGMGQNFYDFINSYRIKEVKKQLDDPDNNEKNLLNLAFNSGFNSKATFNSVFKKNTGMTPTEYKKSISQQDVESTTTPAEDYV